MTFGRVVLNPLLLIVFIVFGASSAAAGEINLPQANGDTLGLAAPAKRIITLAPNLAELVFAAGAGKHLKAVVEYSNFPAQVTEIPRVGDAFRIDLERIIKLEPDLVIAWKSGNPQAALYKLQQLGMKIWQVEITRPEEIAEVVRNISVAAGTQDHGLPVARHLQEKLERLKQANAGKTSVGFFYQISAHPLYTVNGQHIISRSLEICGGYNVFSELPTLAAQISRESVLLADPQTMIAPRVRAGDSELDVWLDWPQLQAVGESAMLYLPADEINQATPRLLDSIELACKLLDEVRKSAQQLEEK